MTSIQNYWPSLGNSSFYQTLFLDHSKKEEKKFSSLRIENKQSVNRDFKSDSRTTIEKAALIALGCISLFCFIMSTYYEKRKHLVNADIVDGNLTLPVLPFFPQSNLSSCDQLFLFDKIAKEGYTDNITSEIGLLEAAVNCIGLDYFNNAWAYNKHYSFGDNQTRFDTNTSQVFSYFKKFFNSCQVAYTQSNAQDCLTFRSSTLTQFDPIESNLLNEIDQYQQAVNQLNSQNADKTVLYLDGYSSPYHAFVRKLMNFRFDLLTDLHTRDSYSSSIALINALRRLSFSPLYKRVFSPKGICNAISSVDQKQSIHKIIIKAHGNTGITALMNPLFTYEDQLEDEMPDDCFKNMSDEFTNHIYLFSCKGAASTHKVESVQDYFLKKLKSSGKKGCVHAHPKVIRASLTTSETAVFSDLKADKGLNYNYNDNFHLKMPTPYELFQEIFFGEKTRLPKISVYIEESHEEKVDLLHAKCV